MNQIQKKIRQNYFKSNGIPNQTSKWLWKYFSSIQDGLLLWLLWCSVQKSVVRFRNHVLISKSFSTSFPPKETRPSFLPHSRNNNKGTNHHQKKSPFFPSSTQISSHSHSHNHSGILCSLIVVCSPWWALLFYPYYSYYDYDYDYCY